MNIVFIGLSLSSAWGNGHATTFRSLIPGLVELGHTVQFLERDVPWYADHRDMPEPPFCRLDYYTSVDELIASFGDALSDADAVIIGSYVPEGVAVIDRVAALNPKHLCFYDIDTPVTLAKLERGDEEYLAARQIPLFDVYFSFSGGDTLARLETQFGAQHAAALYCSVDPAQHRSTGETPEWDLGYLGTYSADRQPVLDKLLLEPARRLPDMRFVVAGPMYPEGIVWPDNVERIDHLPPAQHASFYSCQRFTLNVTRTDMVAAGWSPSVRLFEAAAVGTPIISDWWRGLDELLPDGKALLIAHSSEDVIGMLTTVSPTRRKSIAAEAHARVLKQHTGVARAGELLVALAGADTLVTPKRAGAR
jgi:spore maturation protein CgeB